MYFAGARYYMSALGRWTAVDPLADEHPALGAYIYVDGNPIGAIDPGGKDYVLIINHKRNTITIQATCFVAAGDRASIQAAQSGVSFWNQQSGK